MIQVSEVGIAVAIEVRVGLVPVCMRCVMVAVMTVLRVDGNRDGVHDGPRSRSNSSCSGVDGSCVPRSRLGLLELALACDVSLEFKH